MKTYEFKSGTPDAVRVRANDLTAAKRLAGVSGSPAWRIIPTPPPIVARMIEAADLSGSMRILEPSCGKGNIAAPLHAAGHAVYGVEVIQGLADYCKAQGLSVQRADFMDLTLRDFSLAEGVGGFDRVLMNPPFEKRQDELHIKHAFEFLRPGGRLVAICTSMTANRIGTWVIFRGGLIEALPEGCFQTSERPTGVNVVLITIDK